MIYKKFSYIFTVLLVTASYCATIPVLAVVHTHDAVNAPQTVAFRLNASGSVTEDNPLFCAVCFRLNSTQTISAEAQILPAIHPGYDIVFQSPLSGIPSSHYIYLQNRAPPVIHTIC